MVPTFVLVAGGVVGKLEGADPAALRARVAEFALTKVKQPPPSADFLTGRLLKLTRASHVMLFMKGTPDQPKCKFSRQVTFMHRLISETKR